MLYNKSNLSESLGSTIYRLLLGRPPQGRETVTDAHKSFQNPRLAHGRGLKGRTSDHPGSKQFSNDYLESGHAAQVNVSKINKYKEKEKKRTLPSVRLIRAGVLFRVPRKIGRRKGSGKLCH